MCFLLIKKVDFDLGGLLLENVNDIALYIWELNLELLKECWM